MRHFLSTAMLILLSLGLGSITPAGGKDKDPAPTAPSALAHATVLIIRHAEEPDHGSGLSPAGIAHANACVSYFENYHVDDNVTPIKLTALFAAANSSASHRPYLTLAPLSQAIGLPIDTQYKDNDYAKLADNLQTTDHGRNLLICWHHGHIPDLARALGADPRDLLPDGKWPSDQYGWLIELRYDKNGTLKSSKLVVESL